MEFILDQTQREWDEETGQSRSPHTKAYQKSYDRIEGRTCTEAYFDDNFGKREGAWRSIGVDHIATENGRHIQRRILGGARDWFIKIDTLEELSAFIKENGSCVLMEDGDFLKLEIYNGYRE